MAPARACSSICASNTRSRTDRRATKRFASANFDSGPNVFESQTLARSTPGIRATRASTNSLYTTRAVMRDLTSELTGDRRKGAARRTPLDVRVEQLVRALGHGLDKNFDNHPPELATHTRLRLSAV